jgi:hypothetical protein
VEALQRRIEPDAGQSRGMVVLTDNQGSICKQYILYQSFAFLKFCPTPQGGVFFLCQSQV